MLPREGQRRAAAGAGRPEKDDPSESARRIGTQIADPLVQRKQHTAFGSRLLEDHWIRRPREPFFPDGVHLVTRFPKVIQQLGRDVLVKL